MTALLFLIPLSAIVTCIAVYGIFWSLKNRQYDDLEGESQRILFDKEKNGSGGISRNSDLKGIDHDNGEK